MEATWNREIKQWGVFMRVHKLVKFWQEAENWDMKMCFDGMNWNDPRQFAFLVWVSTGMNSQSFLIVFYIKIRKGWSCLRGLWHLVSTNSILTNLIVTLKRYWNLTWPLNLSDRAVAIKLEKPNRSIQTSYTISIMSTCCLAVVRDAI